MSATHGTQIAGGIHAFVPTAWNGRGRIPAGWSDPAPAASYPLNVGVISYGNWWKGAETHVPEIGNDGTLRTAFKHRQPTAFEPNFYSSDPELTTISLSREQEIADTVLQSLIDGGVTTKTSCGSGSATSRARCARR